jgi:hypothetical protein
MGVLEQLGELLTAFGAVSAAFTVDVFVCDDVTGFVAPFPQLS